MKNNVLNIAEQPGTDGDNKWIVNGTLEINGTLKNGLGQEEIIAVAGALSVDKKVSKLALAGAGAVTLAVPSADMLGQIKVIEMTADNGDITLSLANVQGGTSVTTCKWANVGDALILVAGITKWNVISQGGVVLS